MESQQRPGIRRKSSASNLLSTLQGNRNNSSLTIPNASTGIPREWESVPSPLEAPSPQSSLSVPSSSLESVREAINRRLLSIAHIRQTYEGKSHWLNTVLIPLYDVERTYSNSTMKRRTWKFSVLAMSLSSVFDHRSTDILRSISLILSEYDQLPDQLPDEGSRPRMRNILKGKSVKRTGAVGFDSYEEPGLALNINIPFSLDYFQVVVSFCDVLTEIYIKLRNLLGTTPLMHAGIYHSVPPGVGYSIAISTPSAANSPLYSQLFPEDPTAANPVPIEPSSPGASPFIPGTLSVPPVSTSQIVVESILKVDSRFKKIVNTMLKEVDALARESIKVELSSLNPLLQNLGLSGGGNDDLAGLDFDL